MIDFILMHLLTFLKWQNSRWLLHRRIFLSFLLTYLLTYSLTHSFTHSLTAWSRVLLEKLTGFQLFKKFLAFNRTQKFITTITSSCLLSLSWARLIQSIPPHPTLWRSTLISSSHLCLGLFLCTDRSTATFIDGIRTSLRYRVRICRVTGIWVLLVTNTVLLAIQYQWVSNLLCGLEE